MGLKLEHATLKCFLKLLLPLLALSRKILSLPCASIPAGTDFYGPFYISLYLLVEGCLIQSFLGVLEDRDDASLILLDFTKPTM